MEISVQNKITKHTYIDTHTQTIWSILQIIIKFDVHTDRNHNNQHQHVENAFYTTYSVKRFDL